MNTNKKNIASVIICNYNGYKYLNTCLQSLKEQLFKDFEVILVDNGSNDNSVEFVKEKFSEIKIISHQKNLGFAEGTNSGIKKAKGKYIITLNNDTKVDKNWLKQLVEKANLDNQVGMCASHIVYYEFPEFVYSNGIILSKNGCAYNIGSWQKDTNEKKVKEIFGPCACAALYKKEMLEGIGLFDEDYFAYYEDTDLAFRAQLQGWKCLYVPEAIVYHIHGATSKTFGFNKIKFLVERNKFYTLVKNLPLIYFIKFLPFMIFYHILLSFYYLFVNKNIPVIKGFLVALWNIKKLLKKRKKIQKNKKIKNDYLNKYFLAEIQKYLFFNLFKSKKKFL
ncbi:MAG: glycosyltransferase family 2 protein [bacterium]